MPASPDPQKGGTISNWDNTFALVLGNEVSGDRPGRDSSSSSPSTAARLSAAQVHAELQRRRWRALLHAVRVASVTGVSQSYVMFTVSQYDSYSYLFYQPTFISLDPTVTPSNLPSIPVQGIRIGINGTIPQVGQAYIPLNTTDHRGQLHPDRARCCRTSAPSSALQSGPLTDQFFLTFDELGSQTDVVVEPTPTTPRACRRAGGRRHRREDLRSRSIRPCRRSRACRPSNATVVTTYQAVQQQLPPIPTLEGFSSANQIGVAQLAIQYCNEMVNNPACGGDVPGRDLERRTVRHAGRHRLGHRPARGQGARQRSGIASRRPRR